MPKFAAVLCKTWIVNTGLARLSPIFCKHCRIFYKHCGIFCKHCGKTLSWVYDFEGLSRLMKVLFQNKSGATPGLYRLKDFR